jgi:hypothetical protein
MAHAHLIVFHPEASFEPPNPEVIPSRSAAQEDSQDLSLPCSKRYP